MRRTAIAGLIIVLSCIPAALIAQNAANKAAGKSRSGVIMKIKLTSVMVEDQDKALKFYTDVLGFVKKRDMPAGKYRWLTVISPEGPADVELLLEPNEFPPARAYQKALFEARIPATSFAVDDVQKTYETMIRLGVVFRAKPAKQGETTVAVFDDTCGNLIQIFQQ